jgi:signal peptidase I
MRIILRYSGLALAILVLSLAFITFMAPRFGWKIDVVLSGSMEPELKVGSVVITRPLEVESIKVGDIITFRSPVNERFTTHRVVSLENSPSFILHTKGDANEDMDPFIVGSQSIVGKVCFNVAYLGYAIQFMKSRLGFLITLYLPGLIIVITEALNIWRELVKEKSTRVNQR